MLRPVLVPEVVPIGFPLESIKQRDNCQNQVPRIPDGSSQCTCETMVMVNHMEALWWRTSTSTSIWTFLCGFALNLGFGASRNRVCYAVHHRCDLHCMSSYQVKNFSMILKTNNNETPSAGLFCCGISSVKLELRPVHFGLSFGVYRCLFVSNHLYLFNLRLHGK